MNGSLDFRRVLAETVDDSIAVKRQTLETCAETVEQVADALFETLRTGGKIMLCGNGGSAADAQHVAGEFVGRFLTERRPLPAMALNADTAILTCVGNDYGFEQVFARQVTALAAPGDVLVGISTSGESPNVLRALEAARQRGVRTIAFTGMTGGKLRELADICLCVPSTVTARIQETHITLWHVICDVIDQRLALAGLSEVGGAAGLVAGAP